MNNFLELKNIRKSFITEKKINVLRGLSRKFKLGKIYAIMGPSGSGKSTIGRMLARKLNLNFIDIDSKIENLENLKIKDIFEKKGEIFFRNLELYLLIFLSMIRNFVSRFS